MKDETVLAPARILSRPDGATIAYRKRDGGAPGVIFLGGFRSDMTGAKATALDAFCRDAGAGFLRFDYLGHGESSGAFADGTIGRWAEDAVAALDELTEGPQIVVGSSMGGWIMLLAALRRPARVAGLVGVAAAPDFTEDLMWSRFAPEVRETLRRDGVYRPPSGDAEGEEAAPVTLRLIEEARAHLLLDRPIAIHCPVRLHHGMKDEDVPWTFSARLAEQLLSADVRVSLIKDGDHRLSREGDLRRLCDAVGALRDEVSARVG